MQPDQSAPSRIAVLIPCFQEAASIGQVVAGFRSALPTATIYVYDNNSTDGTPEKAAAAGAVVRHETRQGKGHVVRRMFRELEADIYVLVDGDATYDPPSVVAMIGQLRQAHCDMVVGARVEQHGGAYRPGHRFGNKLLTGFVAAMFSTRLRDMLSGYRVLSRRFVKSFPVLSSGFEIETELTIHALELEMVLMEIDTPYYERPAGSESKLNTWRDGIRILLTIMHIYRSERPLAFFTISGLFCMVAAIVLATPIVVTYFETGLVPRLPTAVLATGLMLTAFLAVACGFILDTVTRGRREMKLLAYLAQPGPNDR